MIRARFKVNNGDYRPVNWPIKHPYWLSGWGDDEEGPYNIVVAYADDINEILRNWPEAREIDVMRECKEYTFTSRFPKPDWFEVPEGVKEIIVG